MPSARCGLASAAVTTSQAPAARCEPRRQHRYASATPSALKPDDVPTDSRLSVAGVASTTATTAAAPSRPDRAAPAARTAMTTAASTMPACSALHTQKAVARGTGVSGTASSATSATSRNGTWRCAGDISGRAVPARTRQS
jgi:hypothetical protein